MNIALLGNGFDINYRLLTSYRNFLLTINFLVNQKPDAIHSVGDVYGSNELQSIDATIKESHELYKKVYDEVALEADTVHRISELAKKNLWFRYFIDSFNKDVGWIDFETEIAYVIDCFQAASKHPNSSMIRYKALEDDGTRYIVLKAFGFFLRDAKSDSGQFVGRTVKPEYTVEIPIHSNNKVVDRKKIIDCLYNELLDFVEMLKLYLKHFVEASTVALVTQQKIKPMEILNNVDSAITLNYTNTYELLMPGTEIFHIHGDLQSDIVLGINSDKYDELENMDVSFVAFKKFYQRSLYNTDASYLRWFKNLSDEGSYGEDIHLVIYGHSLDVTDKDIIENLISVASKITIFYHNNEAKALYIQKLVAMFGRAKFEQIRDKQELRFLSTTIDPLEFSEEMRSNSRLNYMQNIEKSSFH